MEENNNQESECMNDDPSKHPLEEENRHSLLEKDNNHSLLEKDNNHSLLKAENHHQLLAVVVRKYWMKRIWEQFKLTTIELRQSLQLGLESSVNTLRPNTEEVRKKCESLGCQLDPDLRGSVYQILLGVHGRTSDGLDRMADQLEGMPRDLELRRECQVACESMVNTPGEFARSGMETLLLYFCSQKSVSYTSGLASIIAPFFLLDLPLFAIYDCFYKFWTMYMQEERHLTAKRMDMIHLLLSYHDIAFSQYLDQWAPLWSRFIPKDWLTEIFCGKVSPLHHLTILDRVLVLEQPEFGTFIAIAAVLACKDKIMQLSSDQVESFLQENLQHSLKTTQNVNFICALATLMYRKTPRSFAEKLNAPVVYTASDCSFASDSSVEKPDEDIDLNEWSKKPSRTYVGKFYWVNNKTRKAQWEHPTGKKERPPSIICLPVDPEEIVPQLTRNQIQIQSGIRYFVLDCRAMRSSGDIACGKIPSAFSLDPSTFNDPEVIQKMKGVLEPLRGQVHLCLVGHGIAMPPELVTSEDVKSAVRDAVRKDTTAVNKCALFLQKLGFPYIGHLEGGYAAFHAVACRSSFCSSEELIGHVEASCKYCNFDKALLNGSDPLQEDGEPAMRRNSYMDFIPKKMNVATKISNSVSLPSMKSLNGFKKVRSWYKSNNEDGRSPSYNTSNDNQVETEVSLISRLDSDRIYFTIDEPDDDQEVEVPLPYATLKATINIE